MQDGFSTQIGETLVEKGVITLQQLQQVLTLQKERGGYLCTLIIKFGFADQNVVLKLLSQQIGVEYVDLKKAKIDLQTLEKVPAKVALRYKLMPIRFEGNKLLVALADPLDIHKLDDVRILLNTHVEAVLSYEEDILDSIKKYYGVGAEIVEELMTGENFEEILQKRSHKIQDVDQVLESASIIKLVNQILTQAVEKKATDIHIEPFEEELKVRLRIDGFLYDVPISESIREFHPAIVSRIKVMANLNLTEHRLFQDGRITIKVKGEDVDLRVSIVPSSYGECIQIRILNPFALLELESLGMLEEDLDIIKKLIYKPYGVLFITGPTGSGKSTTLYAFLQKKNLPNVKIITIEDPVEYQIPGIVQIQANPQIGVTFAQGLRAVLRHDPDIIMVGEVRDVETAEIAIRSAMTGHLVLSTLHTNDAANTPLRLIEMGIEPFLVSSSLEGVVAQRLVRTLCPSCKEKISVSSSIFKEEGLQIKEENVEIFNNKGCEKCRFTGFKGRSGIFEVLVLTEEIKDVIFRSGSSQRIKELAIANGMYTLRQDGLRKVLKGTTTLNEVMRVTNQ